MQVHDDDATFGDLVVNRRLPDQTVTDIDSGGERFGRERLADHGWKRAGCSHWRRGRGRTTIVVLKLLRLGVSPKMRDPIGTWHPAVDLERTTAAPREPLRLTVQIGDACE